MRIVGPALAIASLLVISAAWAEAPKTAPDRVAPVLGRLAKMDRASQQAWLRRLEEREARAAKIAETYDAPPLPPGLERRAPPAKLTPEEAAKEIAAVRGLIHRKMVTWKSLREAIEKTDAREQDAIQRLRNRYQDQVFESFNEHVDEYGRRQDAWHAVLKSWQAAGAPFEAQDRLINWLEAGIRSASPKTIGPVPEKPDFGGGTGAETAKPQAEKKAKEPAKPPAEKKTTEEPTKPQAEQPAKPQAEKKTTEELVKPQAEKKAREPAKPQAEKKAEEPAKPQMEKKPGGGAAATGMSGESRVPPPSPVRVVRKPQIDEADQSPAGPVEVNVEELAARIAGCNMAMRALEADLDENGTWDAARLAPLVERLKILVLRRGDLDLFREVVPAEKRSGVTRLDSPKTAISQLGARIFAARNQASSPKFSGTEADRRAESERLETLSRRLAEVEGK